MMKDSYINSICNKLQYYGKEKAEIRKEIKTEVDALLKSGKTLDEIVQELGTPREVAAHYNKLVSEKNRKKVRKIKASKIFVTAIILIFLICAVGYWMTPRTYEIGVHNDHFDETTVVEQAKQTARHIGTQKFETLLTEYANEDLRKNTSVEQLKKAYEDVDEDWGTLVSFGDYYAEEVIQTWHDYAMISIYTSYENTSVTVTLTYDRDMKLAGIYFEK